MDGSSSDPADNDVSSEAVGGSENKTQADAVNKVVVHFRATGDAQILKQSKFKISEKERFQTVVEYLRKMLKSKASDPLFFYVNSAFQPSPDEIVANLYQCFNLDGKLVINYCTNPAWG